MKINLSNTKRTLIFSTFLALSPQIMFAGTFKSRLFNVTADDSDALIKYINKVFNWSQKAILILATVVITIAGIIYMTSAGNEKQISLSKKYIVGALSGVAVVILGKFFLQYVIGVPWIK